MNQIANTVLQGLLEAIKSDSLVLPTLPEVALQIREIAEDPEADLDQLAAVIVNDAGMTARIIKIANSPLLRAPKQIEDLKMALMRLGIEYTCNIATGLAMEQMFQATSDIVDKRLRDTWSRSGEIAGISHVLCKHFTNLRPDQATLAGLIHRIGVLPILTYAEENPSLLRDSFTLDKVIEALHSRIGDQILEKWEFPEALRKIPSQYKQFERQLDSPDYADIVTVAMLQSYMGTSHPMAQVDYATVTAFGRLGLNPDMQEEQIEDLSDEMEAAMQLLS
ncbi:HDOD domain-containing protein [Aestuariicella sp. G3-2]|uniref:HDOD domain-containing protein n=1 Tax=Pseudomaricurvus albidus TaxID=2842452 RepID=UPI001C0DFC5E|nr:HDOD domain-containing protein [Aestuariicella albida]MBU3069905.1 HDOD domain-containing protein [Aestuariicella albida]